MTKDWHQWHRHYDTRDSSLDQRLNAVRRDLRRALAEAPCGADGVVRLTSTEDGVFRVGMHRLAAEHADVRTPQPGTRMFTFV